MRTLGDNSRNTHAAEGGTVEAYSVRAIPFLGSLVDLCQEPLDAAHKNNAKAADSLPKEC